MLLKGIFYLTNNIISKLGNEWIMGVTVRNVCLPAFIHHISVFQSYWESCFWNEITLCPSACQRSLRSLSSAPLTISDHLHSLSVLFTFLHRISSHFTLYILSQPQLSSSPLVSYSGQKTSQLPGLIWGIQVAGDWDRGLQKGQLFHIDKRLCSCLISDTIQPDL